MDVQYAVLGPNHKTVSVDISRRWKDPLKQPKTRPKIGRAQGLDSINTNLVLPSGKPRSITLILVFNILYIFIMHLRYKELIGTQDA